MVLDILRWRKSQNAAGGRLFLKLSESALTTLNRGSASRDFCRKFFNFPPTLVAVLAISSLILVVLLYLAFRWLFGIADEDTAAAAVLQPAVCPQAA